MQIARKNVIMRATTPKLNRFRFFALCLAVLLAHSVECCGTAFLEKMVQAARAQVGVTKSYVADYVKLDYPLGDVSRDRCVCSDVVIRV